MTIKEQESEMMDMFNRKYALSDKINWNAKELGKIEVESRRVKHLINVSPTQKLIYYQDELEQMRKNGKKILRNHIKDRNKLSFAKVAPALGITRPSLVGRYKRFLEMKNAKASAEIML